MKNAEIKVVKFSAEDVIATSGATYAFSGFYDSTSGNGTINGMGKDAFRTYMTNEEMTTNFAQVEAYSNGISVTMNRLFDTSGASNDDAGDTDSVIGKKTGNNYSAYAGYFNGSFTWDGTKFIRQ